MASLKELRKIRLEKLVVLKRAGVNPYPLQVRLRQACLEADKDFVVISKKGQEIVLAGRLVSLRIQGGVSFGHIEDGTARFQILLKKDSLGEKKYRNFINYFDVGDFIEARGTLFKTKKGAKTLKVADFKMLTKSILPLPAKWYGLKDIEERYRKRYLDLLMNPAIKDKFERRGQIIKEIRNFLEKEGFLEVETPILQPIYGGAKARPFKTYLNALDIDLYLRISPELYLKRLLVGGFERVYEIGRIFRNEGMDRFHNPDFTMLEFYWAFADYKDLMKFTERMFEYLLKKLFGKSEISYQGKKINFKTPWPRIEFSQLIRKETKIDLEEINGDALFEEAGKLGIQAEKGASKAEIADEIYKKICLPKIWQPTFIIHHPRGKSSLAKCLEKNPEKLASLQLVAGGWELVWAYSELNDPIEQRKRFEEQERFFKSGLEEAQRMDEDFLEALEYGMPPAAGFGMGIDRLAALLTDSHSLKEVILFPTMRPKNK